MHENSVHMQSFSVPFQYPVIFTRGLFQPDSTIFESLFGDQCRVKLFVVIEKAVSAAFPALTAQIADYCAAHPRLTLTAPPLAVDGAEGCKTIGRAEELCGKMLNAGLCRQSYLVMIGGGALLDTAGFAGTIFHRGVRQIRIPTTGLSQCDSGVGVKNAVNAFGKKNLLGVFAPPYAVVNDFDFLRTLPLNVIAAAASEAVKVALIKNADFFHWIQAEAKQIRQGNYDLIETMVRRSAEIHCRHIAENGDPFEFGSARPLDFGHWAAHKLEMLSGNRISHGDAVSMGMRIDTRYAVLKKIAPISVDAALNQVLDDLQLPFAVDELEKRTPDGARAVIAGIEEFREHLGGQLHITVPTGIGSKMEVQELDSALLEQAIAQLIRERK